MTTEQRSTLEPASPPLFVGAGVQFAGTITHAGSHGDRAVILGEFVGDMEWNGTMVLPQGGKVIVEESIRCREMVVGGEIVGSSGDVVIETGLLRLAESAAINVATINVPPGGLEQSRGAVVNAKLTMSKENVYAAEASQATQIPPAPAVPRLILASTSHATSMAPTSDGLSPAQAETSASSETALTVALGAR